MSNAADPLVIMERVLQLLADGDVSATYKYAVLLALVDLCVEGAARQADLRHGAASTSVTTRQLAEKVIANYWDQAADWRDDFPTGGRIVLKQNQSVKGDEAESTSILGRICGLRRHLEANGNNPTIGRAATTTPMQWLSLVDKVEWTLIEYPLPKLQRIDRQDERWLYVLTWNDSDNKPIQRNVTAYQRRFSSNFDSSLVLLPDFDNRVQLLPGVADAFVRLSPLLRPHIQRVWAEKVRALNARLPSIATEHRLSDFLFGQARINLNPVRAGLMDLQHGQCFYCPSPLKNRETQVDHFLPWSRFSNNSVANLVLTDTECNSKKSDWLPGFAHIKKWVDRLESRSNALEHLAIDTQWELGIVRSRSTAMSAYSHLPDGARLWRTKREFDVWDPGVWAGVFP